MSKEISIKEKELPFYNISIEKQIDILKAFAVLREEGKVNVTYKEVAQLTGLHPNSVSGCIKFWKSIGLLDEDNGGHKASDITLTFSKKLDWEEDEAWSIIRTHLAETWFGKLVTLAFKMNSSLSENELIKRIGSASDKMKKSKNVVRSIKLIMELLELSKTLIKKSDGNYVLNPEISGTSEKISIEIPENKDLQKVLIGKEAYVIDIRELVQFIKERGKKLAKKEIKLN